MECKKLICEPKSMRKISYNNRKECIKKKTMELATLCGIDACTIMYGADGEFESWPENPAEVKAILNRFKDLTTNPYKRTSVRDESHKKLIHVPGGDVPCQTTTIRDESTMKRCSRQSSVSGYQEFLKQLDSKLEALTKRIEFLRRDQEYDTTFCCTENKQPDYSEKNTRMYYSEMTTSPKRRKISQAPVVFPFDLNYPPPDEPKCSSFSFQDCNVLPNHVVHMRFNSSC